MDVISPMDKYAIMQTNMKSVLTEYLDPVTKKLDTITRRKPEED